MTITPPSRTDVTRRLITPNALLPDLATAVNTQILALVNGKTASASTQNIFSTQNDAGSSYVWSATAITAALDLTCIPAYGDGNSWYPGVAVSANYMIGNYHAGSTDKRFVAANGTVTTINVSDTRIIGVNGEIFTTGQTSPGGADNTDIAVFKLASALPAGVTFAKVACPDLFSWFAGLSNALDPNPPPQVPVLRIDQDRVAYIHGLLGLYSTAIASPQTVIRQTLLGPFTSWWAQVRDHDSASPTFLIIDGTPVLLMTFRTQFYGPSLTYWYASINAAMAVMGGTDQLTPFRPTSYQNYG